MNLPISFMRKWQEKLRTNTFMIFGARLDELTRDELMAVAAMGLERIGENPVRLSSRIEPADMFTFTLADVYEPDNRSWLRKLFDLALRRKAPKRLMRFQA